MPIRIRRIGENDGGGGRHLQKHPSIDWRFGIERHLLPTFVASAFQPSSPEYRGNADEQRLVGRVFTDAFPPPKPVPSVPVVARLPRMRNQFTGPVQKPLRIEVRRIVAVGRGIIMALPQVREAHGSLGNEHPFIPIVLYRGVWNAQRGHGTLPERLFD